MSNVGMGYDHGGACYYSVLGLCKQATENEIRCGYRKLAMVASNITSLFFFLIFVIVLCYEFCSQKILIYLYVNLKKWHPDRWMKDPKFAGEAKRRFQQIQEAYSGIFFLKLKKEEKKNTHTHTLCCLYVLFHSN